MKNLLFIISLLLPLSTLMAQNIDVPASIQQSYAKMFTAQPASWQMEAENYIVSFEEQGKTKYALFSPQGKWIQTETVIPSTEVSAQVQDAVQARFLTNNYQLVEYLKIANTTETFEGVHLTTGTNHIKVFFDNQGKIKKRVVF